MSEVVLPANDVLITQRPRLVQPQQFNRSQWTGGGKTVGMPGLEYWRGKVLLRDIATEEAERPWRAWLTDLGGPANWFRYYLPCANHDGGKPKVAYGATDGYELPLIDMDVSKTILVAGQYLTVPLPSGRLRAVMLMEDLTTDSAGAGSVRVRPALSEAPASGVTVESMDPFVPMSPSSDDLGIDEDEGISGTAFDCEEMRREPA